MLARDLECVSMYVCVSVQSVCIYMLIQSKMDGKCSDVVLSVFIGAVFHSGLLWLQVKYA